MHGTHVYKRIVYKNNIAIKVELKTVITVSKLKINKSKGKSKLLVDTSFYDYLIIAVNDAKSGIQQNK